MLLPGLRDHGASLCTPAAARRAAPRRRDRVATARSGGAWRRGLAGAAVLLVLVGSAALVLTTARYFSLDPRHAFLVERPWLTVDRLWSLCFHVHVAGGIVCLVTAPWLSWNGLRNGSRRLHRAVGRVHSIAALGWAGPTGFYLAVFAKGGLAGQLGFGALATCFYASTLLGIAAIRRGDRSRHVRWMNRSYALLLSALWFRLVHALLQHCGVEPEANYVAATWASLALAVVAGMCMNRFLVPAERVVTASSGVTQ